MTKARLEHVTWLPEFRCAIFMRRKEDRSAFTREIKRPRERWVRRLAWICNRLAGDGYGNLHVMPEPGWGYFPYERRKKEMPTLYQMQVETAEVLEWAEHLAEDDLADLINDLTNLAQESSRDEAALMEKLYAFRWGFDDGVHYDEQAKPAH